MPVYLTLHFLCRDHNLVESNFAMCPPESIPPAVELNAYSTDESVFKSLMQIKSGSSLPSNVLSDVDPYQFTPSNLPAGVWYFWSGSKTDTENGFWRSTGETRETCSSLITCSRKTLQFYEGTTSEGQKTNLMMQEYTTNDKCSGQKVCTLSFRSNACNIVAFSFLCLSLIQPASELPVWLDNLQDPRALYKVFFTDAAGSGSGRLSDSEISVKNLDDVARPSTVANQSPDRLLGDYVSRGDYLELDDLAIPLSRSTSADSSCMTRSVTSEDLFDSDALLCELGDDNADHDSRGKLNLSASAKLKEVVVQPTTLGMPFHLFYSSGVSRKPKKPNRTKTEQKFTVWFWFYIL
ncbi:putative transcription factor NAM family [Helianthus annuus]|nr:putative transcription factor NAM family [Helianthus annuus]KAJ0644047.1 putative transcription factor NAM family [Helianthus annuus]